MITLKHEQKHYILMLTNDLIEDELYINEFTCNQLSEVLGYATGDTQLSKKLLRRYKIILLCYTNIKVRTKYSYSTFIKKEMKQEWKDFKKGHATLFPNIELDDQNEIRLKSLTRFIRFIKSLPTRS